MVMYTKKYPRLSDGYHDRHTYEKDVRYSAKAHESRHNERNSHDRRDYEKSPSHYSSPRYIHKPSYSDRNKDKYDKAAHATENVIERKFVAKPLKSSKVIDEELQCENEASNSSHLDGSEQRCDKRDNSDAANDDQDQRDEVLKTAVRICGLWSEHISSSGKRYYYNSETEVSQWEKPKEWTYDTPKSSDGRRLDDERKLEGKDDKHRHHSNQSNSGSKASQDFEKLANCKQTNKHDTVLPLQNGDRQDTAHSVTTANKYSKKEANSTERVVETIENHKVKSSAASSTDKRVNIGEHKSKQQSTELDGQRSQPVVVRAEDNHVGDDMDISPGNSPKHLQQTAAAGLQDAVVRNGHKKIPTSIPNPCSGSPAIDTVQFIRQLDVKTIQTIDRNAVIGQALQTLQKIQEAMMNRQAAAAVPQSPRSTCSESPFLPSKSPQAGSHPWQQPPPVTVATPIASVATPLPDDACRPPIESPRSDSGASSRLPRKEVASPAVLSNSAPTASALAQASCKLQQQQPPLQLPAHLSNHFDEQLLAHVAGWQADHAERLARRYGDEAHSLGSLHCTKVSVELKKARSLVRIAEIQSTLQEHRILFLQHRILELENSDKNFTTQ